MRSSTEAVALPPSADVALLEKIAELSLIRALNDRLAQAATFNVACQMLVDLVREERAASAVEYVSIDAGRGIARLEATAPEEIAPCGAHDVDLAHEAVAALLEHPEPRVLARLPVLPWHAGRRTAAEQTPGRPARGVLISAPTRVRGVTTGLLLVYTEGDQERLGEDLRLLSIAATSAALALDVARRDVREEFLAMLRHDINNPVSVAVGYTEMIVEQCREEGRRDLLDLALSVEESLKAVSDLVSNYLHMPAIDRGAQHLERAPLDLADLAAKVAESYRLCAAEKQIELECRGFCPNVEADRRPLTRVVGNLLSNAIKYTRGPGRVTITCGGDAGAATLAVADTGYGLTRDDLPRLFTKHARFHRDRGIPGTGLGLYICREIVGAHGGTIEVASEPGRGSTFTVRLPAAPRA
jgi:signal transduction histidine kinase